MKKINNLTAVISSIIISMACIISPLSVYGEELIHVYFNGRTGDITKVEYQLDDNKIIEKRQTDFSPFPGLKMMQTFEHSLIGFLDKDERYQFCCKLDGLCDPRFCDSAHPVKVTFRFDRKGEEFTSLSLNSMSQEELKKRQKEQFDAALRVMQPRTRSYHLAVVESESGPDVLVIDENRNVLWR